MLNNECIIADFVLRRVVSVLSVWDIALRDVHQ